MGSWGYTFTENDSAMDYIDNMGDIIGFSEELSILKNTNKTLNENILNDIKNSFTLKREELLNKANGFQEDTLTFALYLVQLKIIPNKEEITIIKETLKKEYENIQYYKDKEGRKKVLDTFITDFDNLIKIEKELKNEFKEKKEGRKNQNNDIFIKIDENINFGY